MSDAAVPFDTLAENYARYRIGYADDVYAILEREGVGAGTRVLDLACGTGLVTAELVARGAIVTGIDVSQPMLDEAAARVPGATFGLGRAEAIAFPAGSFDALVCAQAFHWFDQDRALEECARVVRPGGLVAIWWKTLTRGDTLRLVRDDLSRELGLEIVPDILSTGFPAFDRSTLAGHELRVVPWNVERTAAEIVGYERSRARSARAYGDRLEDYLAALARRLGSPAAPHVLSYVHYLYLARVAPADGR